MKQPTVRKAKQPLDSPRCAHRREQVLDAAGQLFAEASYPDTDMQALADRLGVGKGTIYRYFPSKQDLFLATVDRVIRRLHQRTSAAVAEVEDPLEGIARAIHAYLAFFADHPNAVELLIQERAQFKDRKPPTYFAYREANVQRWRNLYRDLIAAGRVRDVPVERISDTISDLLYGTIFTNYFTGPRKPAAEQARDVIDIVFHGILSYQERVGNGTT